MNKQGLILIGAGGHAQSCIDVVEHQGRYQIVGLIASHKELNKSISNYKVIGTDLELNALSQSCPWALIAVGQIKTPEIRINLYRELIKYGFKLPIIISPFSYVSPSASIGPGTIVMHGAVINAGACIGSNCIINSCALIEHGVTVGDHVHISTGAVLNGEVSVGMGSFIGSAAVIRESVSIGERSLVGMGVRVRHSLGDDTQFIGDSKTS